MTFKGALSTAATRLMASLCEDEIQGAHEKECLWRNWGRKHWVTEDVAITFSHILDFTVIISDRRNNWQKKNDYLLSELASGKKTWWTARI